MEFNCEIAEQSLPVCRNSLLTLDLDLDFGPWCCLEYRISAVCAGDSSESCAVSSWFVGSCPFGWWVQVVMGAKLVEVGFMVPSQADGRDRTPVHFWKGANLVALELCAFQNSIHLNTQASFFSFQLPLGHQNYAGTTCKCCTLLVELFSVHRGTVNM